MLKKKNCKETFYNFLNIFQKTKYNVLILNMFKKNYQKKFENN